jgi:hypothetical protein
VNLQPRNKSSNDRADYNNPSHGASVDGRNSWDQDSIVLLTEYKNWTAYMERAQLFASIREHLPSSTPRDMPEMLRLYGTDEHMFLEVPAEDGTLLKLLTKQ